VQAPATTKLLGYQGLRQSLHTAAGEALAGPAWTCPRSRALVLVSALRLAIPAAGSPRRNCPIGAPLYAGGRQRFDHCTSGRCSRGVGLGADRGTGGNCRGRDPSAARRAPQGRASASGSSAAPGTWLIRLFTRSPTSDLARARTSLTNVFIDLTGAKDLEDLIQGIDLDRYHLEAAWAPKVFQAAQGGDKIARDVIDRPGIASARAPAASSVTWPFRPLGSTLSWQAAFSMVASSLSIRSKPPYSISRPMHTSSDWLCRQSSARLPWHAQRGPGSEIQPRSTNRVNQGNAEDDRA